MSLRTRIVQQFRKPTGPIGSLAGWMMAHRSSNVQRNAWTVGLLALEPHHRVLELGCGPGLALKACAERAGNGEVVGVDHSQVMLRQAGRRLAAEIAAGRVRLVLGGVEAIAALDQRFDRIFSLNVVQFLPDLDEAYRIFFTALADDGTVATTYQPREVKPTAAQARAMADRIAEAMRHAGFAQIAVHELGLRPAPAICVTGARSGRT